MYSWRCSRGGGSVLTEAMAVALAVAGLVRVLVRAPRPIVVVPVCVLVSSSRSGSFSICGRSSRGCKP